MSNNPWQSLQANFTADADSFNDVIAGGKYMDEGDHDNCTIEGLEPAKSKAGNDYVKVIWKNADGQTITDRVMLNSKPDQQGVIKPHFTYTRLLRGIISDVQLRLEFSNLVKTNPAYLASLVGFRGRLKVGPGRDGVTLKKNAAGDIQPYDVQTKTFVGDVAFDSYKAAAEYVKEAGFTRAFPEVSEIRNPSEGLEENEKALRSIIATAAGTKPAGAAGVRPIQGAAVRRPI